MAFEGANPDQLDALAAQFNGTAQRLEDIRATVTRRLGYSSWKGPAADRFRHQWTTSAHAIDATASALRHAQKILNDNANQQRGASGEATKSGGSDGGLFGKLLKDAESVIGTEVKAAHDALHAVVHGAEAVVGAEVKFAKEAWNGEVKGWEDIGKVVAKDWEDFVKSPAFNDIIEVAKVVSAVAPIIAIVCPVLAPELLVLTAVASVVVLAGDLIKMANTSNWDGMTIAEDRTGAALSVVGAGFATSAAGALLKGGEATAKIAEGGSKMNLLTRMGTDIGTLPKVQQPIVILRTVDAGLNIGDGATKVTTDLANQDYQRAALDSSSIVAGVAGLDGAGHDGHLVQNLIDPVVGAEHTAAGMMPDTTNGGTR